MASATTARASRTSRGSSRLSQAMQTASAATPRRDERPSHALPPARCEPTGREARSSPRRTTAVECHAPPVAARPPPHASDATRSSPHRPTRVRRVDAQRRPRIAENGSRLDRRCHDRRALPILLRSELPLKKPWQAVRRIGERCGERVHGRAEVALSRAHADRRAEPAVCSERRRATPRGVRLQHRACSSHCGVEARVRRRADRAGRIAVEQHQLRPRRAASSSSFTISCPRRALVGQWTRRSDSPCSYSPYRVEVEPGRPPQQQSASITAHAPRVGEDPIEHAQTRPDDHVTESHTSTERSHGGEPEEIADHDLRFRDGEHATRKTARGRSRSGRPAPLPRRLHSIDAESVRSVACTADRAARHARRRVAPRPPVSPARPRRGRRTGLERERHRARQTATSTAASVAAANRNPTPTTPREREPDATAAASATAPRPQHHRSRRLSPRDAAPLRAPVPSRPRPLTPAARASGATITRWDRTTVATSWTSSGTDVVPALRDRARLRHAQERYACPRARSERQQRAVARVPYERDNVLADALLYVDGTSCLDRATRIGTVSDDLELVERRSRRLLRQHQRLFRETADSRARAAP